MWHVSSRSGVATLRTAIHLLFTYLLMISLVVSGSLACCLICKGLPTNLAQVLTTSSSYLHESDPLHRLHASGTCMPLFLLFYQYATAAHTVIHNSKVVLRFPISPSCRIACVAYVQSLSVHHRFSIVISVSDCVSVREHISGTTSMINLPVL